MYACFWGARERYLPIFVVEVIRFREKQNSPACKSAVFISEAVKERVICFFFVLSVFAFTVIDACMAVCVSLSLAVCVCVCM